MVRPQGRAAAAGASSAARLDDRRSALVPCAAPCGLRSTPSPRRRSRGPPWVNVATLRMDKQRGRPVLVEFWDFCRVQLAAHAALPQGVARALRAATGCASSPCTRPGFAPSRDEDAVRAAVARLGIEHPVLHRHRPAAVAPYDNEGWPARYLFDRAAATPRTSSTSARAATRETERAIQELLGVERDAARAAAPRGRPEGARSSSRRPTSPARSRARTRRAACGRCSTARGDVRVERPRDRASSTRARTRSLEHERHTTGVLDLEVGDGVSATPSRSRPGVAPAYGRRLPAAAASSAARAAAGRRRRARPRRPASTGSRRPSGRGTSRSWTQEPRVDAAGPPPRAPTRPGRRARAARRGACGRRAPSSASMPRRRDDLAHRRAGRRGAAPAPDRSARTGPSPARLSARDRRAGSRPASARCAQRPRGPSPSARATRLRRRAGARAPEARRACGARRRAASA